MIKGNKIIKFNKNSWSMDGEINKIKLPYPKYRYKKYIIDRMNLELWNEELQFLDIDDWYIPTSVKLKYYKDNE